ncbi:MAG: hybrid sensor histidine kinase/response regulator [Deltaproteobacteria bacterium]|nr:hybrid sensor histidine kinase/response regulator [Deltaproteobacteria bacterium]
MNEEEFLIKLRAAFKAEAEERLNAMASCLMEYETSSDQERQQTLIEEVFREAHSLKGAARTVNLGDIENICQAIESVFALLRKGELQLSPEIFDVLHLSLDIINLLLTESASGQAAPEPARISSLILQIEQLKKPKETPPLPPPDLRPADSPKIISPSDQETNSEQPQNEWPSDDSCQQESDPPDQPKSDLWIQSCQAKPLVSETVRISAAKLYSLRIKAEELIALKIAANQQVSLLKSTTQSVDLLRTRQHAIESECRWLRRLVGKSDGPKENHQNLNKLAKILEYLEWTRDHAGYLGREFKALAKAADQDSHTLRLMIDDLVEDTRKATMLPFTTLFDILPRIIRDISRDRGKEVDLRFQGGDIEIGRRILERIKDPFIHLIRNAIDHGVEHPDQRETKGKPRRGSIDIVVSQRESSKVEIVFSDDGQGIDLVKIKAEAVKRGILTQNEVAQLTDQEALSLICRPELSTSSMITTISGRGVGMSVVKENIEQLGGQLAIATRLGQGSTFKMVLPLTLSSFRCVLVQVADHLFALPSAHIQRVSRVSPKEVQTVENKATVLLEEWPVSLVELAEVLELPLVAEKNGESAFFPIVVVETIDKKIAFRVDEVLGEQEVLVKSLGNQLSRVRNIAGATVLGSGRVVPILNIHDLMKSASKPGPGRVQPLVSKDRVGEKKKKSILVAEDSITSRMLIKNILESAGYTVKTAVDGVDAYSWLRTDDFDLIISDVEMPRMNGFDLTSKIRQDKRLEEIPVVLVTGLESPQDRERGIDVGANAYIIKSSFDQGNLLDIISRLI